MLLAARAALPLLTCVSWRSITVIALPDAQCLHVRACVLVNKREVDERDLYTHARTHLIEIEDAHAFRCAALAVGELPGRQRAAYQQRKDKDECVAAAHACLFVCLCWNVNE